MARAAPEAAHRLTAGGGEGEAAGLDHGMRERLGRHEAQRMVVDLEARAQQGCAVGVGRHQRPAPAATRPRMAAPTVLPGHDERSPGRTPRRQVHRADPGRAQGDHDGQAAQPLPALDLRNRLFVGVSGFCCGRRVGRCG
jgi:hypothetical protein